VATKLAAVHQYMYFHFILYDQGYDALANLFMRTAIMEMGHVEILAETHPLPQRRVEMKAAGEVQK
jgi:bacterioferritin